MKKKKRVHGSTPGRFKIFNLKHAVMRDRQWFNKSSSPGEALGFFLSHTKTLY